MLDSGRWKSGNLLNRIVCTREAGVDVRGSFGMLQSGIAVVIGDLTFLEHEA